MCCALAALLIRDGSEPGVQCNEELSGGCVFATAHLPLGGVRREDHHSSSDLHTIIEIDHVDIQKTDAPRGASLSDQGRLVRPMNADNRIDITLIEIHGPCTQWISLAAGHSMNPLNDFRMFRYVLWRGHPNRPFFLALDLG